MSKSVLCAGRSYCDLIFSGVPRLPSAGTEVFADKLTMRAGGGAFITAATLASLGHRAGLMTVLPRNPFGPMVLAELQKFNVGSALCEPAAPDTDPQMTVAIPTQGDRAFLTRIDGPAVPKLGAKDFQGFDHLHFGELRTLQENPWLLQMAKTAGLSVSADCSWQDAFDPGAQELIEALDVFLPNDCEAKALQAIGIPKVCASLTVVKAGENGARAKSHDDPSWINCPAKPAQIVDPTGAGDAFNGGFLSAWLNGKTLTQCLELGNDMGHASVKAIGGTGGLPVRAAN